MSKKNNEVKAQEVSNTVLSMDATQVVDAIQAKLGSEASKVFGGKLSEETLRQVAIEVGYIQPSGRAGTLPTPQGLTFAGVSPEDYARAQAEKKAADFKTREMAKMEKKLAELRGGTAPITQPTPVNPSA
jgi:hypothetical protein